MAKKVKIPTKFKATIGIAGRIGGFDIEVVTDGAFADGSSKFSSVVRDVLFDAPLSGIEATVQYKDGVTDSFDGLAGMTWTVTMKYTDALYATLLMFGSPDTRLGTVGGYYLYGAKEKYLVIVNMPEEVKSLGFADGSSYSQVVSIFRKRLGTKTIILQGRGAPPPGSIPVWSQVVKF